MTNDDAQLKIALQLLACPAAPAWAWHIELPRGYIALLPGNKIILCLYSSRSTLPLTSWLN